MAARYFESVAGTFVRGRRITSNVAFEGNSDANLTSIGPEMDASATVSPTQTIRNMLGEEKKEKDNEEYLPKPNRAEPSARASPSYAILISLVPSFSRPWRRVVLLIVV